MCNERVLWLSTIIAEPNVYANNGGPRLLAHQGAVVLELAVSKDFLHSAITVFADKQHCLKIALPLKENLQLAASVAGYTCGGLLSTCSSHATSSGEVDRWGLSYCCERRAGQEEKDSRCCTCERCTFLPSSHRNRVISTCGSQRHKLSIRLCFCRCFPVF
jgi:hypothetical protein